VSEIANLVSRRQRGCGRVTPLEPVAYRDDHTGMEILTPGVSRLTVDHAVVRDRPEKFAPVSATDKVCRSRLRQHLRAAAARVARELDLARRGGDGPKPITHARPSPLPFAHRAGERWRL
jgi:hypothetical protein